MHKTILGINGTRFTINARATYAESENEAVHGLLFNARFIQGVFDDHADPARFHRFGMQFDPDANTDALIAALPQWYRFGLRAFTVGLQGGGPCYTLDNATIDNNPFSADGTSIDKRCLARLDRLIEAADSIGMVVIVSILYPFQLHRLHGDTACENAVAATARHLRQKGYTNIIIEPCNEFNYNPDAPDIVRTPQGMCRLLDIARTQSGGMPVGCSGSGGHFCPEVIANSDVVLIHGNGQTRNRLHQLIVQCRALRPDAPIVVNEDSADLSNFEVCLRDGVSWGYYNNFTKQEPPADWSVQDGEDLFFALRMAEALHLSVPEFPPQEQFHLHGFERRFTLEAARYPRFCPCQSGDKAHFIRLAALYPEPGAFVEFFLDDRRLDIVYDTPYLLYMKENWLQAPLIGNFDACRKWARVTLRNGQTLDVCAAE